MRTPSISCSYVQPSIIPSNLPSLFSCFVFQTLCLTVLISIFHVGWTGQYQSLKCFSWKLCFLWWNYLILLDASFWSLKKRRELDVSHWKWINLNLLLLLHFVLNLFVRFIIIIQSEVVINLYLNFSALMFTNELSEIAFLLAESGFLLKKTEVSAKKIKHIKVCREEWRNSIILPIWCCWCHSVHLCSFILPIC